MLYDLEHDPNEFNDLGDDPAHESIRGEMQQHLLSYLIGLKSRVTYSDKQMEKRNERFSTERSGFGSGIGMRKRGERSSKGRSSLFSQLVFHSSG